MKLIYSPCFYFKFSYGCREHKYVYSRLFTQKNWKIRMLVLVQWTFEVRKCNCYSKILILRSKPLDKTRFSSNLYIYIHVIHKEVRSDYRSDIPKFWLGPRMMSDWMIIDVLTLLWSITTYYEPIIQNYEWIGPVRYVTSREKL